jgi:Methyltransferase domain
MNAAAMRAWLYGARWLHGARRRLPRRQRPYERRRLVEQLAPGRSFIDVGGMYGVNGESAFQAEAAGATRVVLFDGMDPTAEFEAEHLRRSSRVRYVQGDLHDPTGVEEVGSFDVVWCTGVVYHSPNPYWLLEQLRRLTGERLLLGSYVIPEVPGFEQACLFHPGMSAAGQKAFASALGDKALARVGLSTPLDRRPLMGYANFWWGITPSALRGMLDAANFRILQEFTPWAFSLDVLAAPVGRESSIPPLAFSRERGKARLDARGERPTWA